MSLQEMRGFLCNSDTNQGTREKGRAKRPPENNSHEDKSTEFCLMKNNKNHIVTL